MVPSLALVEAAILDVRTKLRFTNRSSTTWRSQASYHKSVVNSNKWKILQERVEMIGWNSCNNEVDSVSNTGMLPM